MAANTRFSVAVHIMAALAFTPDEQKTSDQLAQSVNTNPVVVRRILSRLVKAGLIRSHTGKTGGCQLARPAGKITLHDVYAAIESDSFFAVHQHNENKHCPVSCSIKQIMGELQATANQAIGESMRKIRLADLMQTIRD